MENKNISDDDDKFFIHFDNTEQCQKFREYYDKQIGHICCWGKGCHLPDVTSWKQLHQIKKDYLANK